MTDTCAYCRLAITPVPTSVTGYKHVYEESEGHDAGPNPDPAYPPTSADIDPAVVRLTRERDAALEALRDVVEIFFYDSRPMEWVARGMGARAQRTIQAIETGAIHNDQ